ncbi:DUF5134 domain-containing protein [Microbacterium sp. LRZ72]|uniref:DUF5134 domain-containing protein n=1 Tax=Microbacterium sp. LRZ72 TaxID=2942481 RepID=UPI0029B3EFD7|nr:DUF5134 domain-containing protein [Microbacterium sp. LRZ72]MDX2377595.1 DUF5134 domain-containing protein [Microbacterium sp. LRZ72]
MLPSPWGLILTLLFATIGLWCAVDLVAHRSRSHAEDGVSSRYALININHLVMSVSMILMIWITAIEFVTWAQVAVFAVFAVTLLPGAFTGGSTSQRVSVVGHFALNAAMIWMLLAMPLLMVGTTTGEAESSEQHHGVDAAAMPAGAADWADAVSMFVIAASAATALWWIVLVFRRRAQRLHDVVYAAMAAGMAAMLMAMNA